jgi:hypothetical protein
MALNPLRALLSALGLSSGVKLRGKRPRAAVGALDDPDQHLSASFGPDGSVEGDIARTAAALACLLLLKTPLDDARVVKARRWLEAHDHDALAAFALGLCAEVQSGGPLHPGPRWLPLGVRGPEGRLLHQLLTKAARD